MLPQVASLLQKIQSATGGNLKMKKVVALEGDRHDVRYVHRSLPRNAEGRRVFIFFFCVGKRRPTHREQQKRINTLFRNWASLHKARAFLGRARSSLLHPRDSF